MSFGKPTFNVRPLDDRSGYVIEAHWPDGETEEIVGVYNAMEGAVRWLNEEAEFWIRDRQDTLH
jgi:hypothetical protein